MREARESLVAKKRGQVSLTQLKPIETIRLEMTSRGCLLSPSANTGSRCETQFRHANFTLCPPSSTIHRESVNRGRAVTGWVWDIMMGKIEMIEKSERQDKKTTFTISETKLLFPSSMVVLKKITTLKSYLYAVLLLFRKIFF